MYVRGMRYWLTSASSFFIPVRSTHIHRARESQRGRHLVTGAYYTALSDGKEPRTAHPYGLRRASNYPVMVLASRNARLLTEDVIDARGTLTQDRLLYVEVVTGQTCRLLA